MRPEKATRIISRAFNKWDYKISPKKFYLFNTTTFAEAINSILKKKIQLEGDIDAYYDDMTDQDDIVDTFVYISDRWGSVGRIKFVKRVLEIE